LFVDIPKVNQAQSHQNGFYRIHKALGNIEEKARIDADCKKGKGKNIGNTSTFFV